MTICIELDLVRVPCGNFVMVMPGKVFFSLREKDWTRFRRCSIKNTDRDVKFAHSPPRRVTVATALPPQPTHHRPVRSAFSPIAIAASSGQTITYPASFIVCRITVRDDYKGGETGSRKWGRVWMDEWSEAEWGTSARVGTDTCARTHAHKHSYW